MIELLEQRLKRPPDIGEIQHPAFLRSHRAADMDLDPKRMAMQPPALVINREIRQKVRGFDSENFEYVHKICGFASEVSLYARVRGLNIYRTMAVE